jgi:GT2 family glycosyltransferase
MSSMAPTQVSVVIVNWHSEDLLALALAALNKQTVAPGRVVIVDNGSSGELPLDQYSLGPISVMRMAQNEGFAAGNNRAIQQEVNSEWVALLNPDAIPEPNWLEQLMNAAERYPDVSAFGTRQLMEEDHALIDGLGDVYHVCGAAWRDGHGQTNDLLPAEPREIFAPCAAAALYKRAALLEAGGFDEDFFCYFEDVDLGFRLRLLGHKTMLVPDAIVYHLGGATSGGRQSDFAVYHGQRNLVWTYFKNMPWPYFWLFLFQHLLFNVVSIAFFVSRGQGKVILSAKWSALRGLPRMISKRRVIQSGMRVPRQQVRAVMAEGWLTPYRRRMPKMSRT